MRRTAVVNQIRGLLLERGLPLHKGRSHVDHALPEILTDPALRLSGSLRVLLGQLQLELEQLTARIEQMDAVIQQTARENEACQRLTAIPGIGPVTATALVAAIGNGAGFRRGKDLAAWVGMVPPRVFHGRQAEAARHQQTGELVSAKAIRARGTSRDAVSHQTGSRAERLVIATDGPHPPKCSRGGAGEYAAPNGLGGLVQKREISGSFAGHSSLSSNTK